MAMVGGGGIEGCVIEMVMLCIQLIGDNANQGSVGSGLRRMLAVGAVVRGGGPMWRVVKLRATRAPASWLFQMGCLLRYLLARRWVVNMGVVAASY